jgi:hypothetical protein
MKKILAFALPLLMVSAGFAQTRTTGGATGGGTTGGSGGLTNFGSSGFGATGGTTGGLTTGGSTTGAIGGVGGTGGFGQGFTFNSGLGLGASPMGMSGMGGMTGRSGFGGMGGMMGMGGMGMGMGMGGMGGGRGGQTGRGGAGGMGGTQQQYQIRPTVKLGFEVARPSGQQRTQQFTSTIARLPQPERFAGISVKVDGRTAIATGKLGNTADATLLKNLLLMEPGIYEVDISALTGQKNSTSPSDKPATRTEQVPAVPAPQ